MLNTIIIDVYDSTRTSLKQSFQRSEAFNALQTSAELVN